MKLIELIWDDHIAAMLPDYRKYEYITSRHGAYIRCKKGIFFHRDNLPLTRRLLK